MRTKYFIQIFIFFLILSCTKENKNDSDSVKNEFYTDYDKYIELSKSKKSPKDKKYLLDIAFNKIKNFKNTPEARNSLSKIIYEYYFINDLEGLESSSRLLLKNSTSANDSINLGFAYRTKALYFNNIKILDSSFKYYFKAEKLYLKLNDKVNYAASLLNKGKIQYKGGDNLGSDLTLTRAYNIFNELNDDRNLSETLIVLGNVSEELKEFDKAIVYHSKSLEIAVALDKTDSQNRRSICYNNIGFVNIKLNDFPKAISNFNLGLQNTNYKDNPELYANFLDNLAYSKLQLKDTSGLPEMFFKALKIRDSLQTTSSIVLSNIHLSKYYTFKKEPVLAQKYAVDALKIAKKAKNPNDVLVSLHQAAEVDNVNAVDYNKEYIVLSDSLQLAERKSKDRFARMQLETDQIIQEKDVLEGKNRTLLYIFVISFVLVALLFVVRAQRARTRELLFKQAQQKANEEIFNLMMSQQSIIDESRNKEKKRLAQDLHDGILGRMFGLRLNLDSLNSNIDVESAKMRHELLNELKTIEQDIREISHDLNREKLVLINNFVSIVHNLLEDQKTLHEVAVTYNIDTTINWDKIGNAIKINLYRILQEGIQNINKYANAKNIKVEITGDKENVYLKIKDDGIGFDVNKKSKGIGMQNMISRTNDCQGIIDVKSEKGKGTRIVITVPIEIKQLIEEQA